MKHGLALRSLLLAVLWVGGCQSTQNPLNAPKTPPSGLSSVQSTLSTEIDKNRTREEAQKTVPADVARAMLPNVDVREFNATGLVETEKRFDVSVKEMPAKAFFISLVKDTPYSIVVDPNVSGNITLQLKNVTIPQTLQAIHDAYGFTYEKTSYGYHVLSENGIITRVFSISYLNIRRAGNSRTLVSSGDITSKIGVNGKEASNTVTRSLYDTPEEGASSNGLLGQRSSGAHATINNNASSSVQTESRADFWSELKRTLLALVGNTAEHSVVVNPDAGLVIVKTNPKVMEQVEQYLKSLQNIMTRQVIIDAKILEVVLSKNYEAGIDWSVFGARQEGTLAFPLGSLAGFTRDLSASIFTLRASNRGAFSTVVKLLSTQGDVKVLSSPRIATLNNQQAVIKVGKDQFFVTNFKTSTLASSGATDQSQDIEMTPFFSGIALDVTPEIDEQDNVTLHIHPIVSQVSDDQKIIDLGTSRGTVTLPMAISQVRESDSIVRAHDDQIIVIGGLMENKITQSVAKVPGLGDAPVIGSAFRRTFQEAQKTELVILLKPKITSLSVWSDTVKEEQKSLSHVSNGWH